MVAVVTGNNLGLVAGSAGVLGGSGQLGSAATGRGGDIAFVNASTGNLTIQRQDELLMGLGPDIGIVRTYNSNGTFDFDNNDNWQISLYRRVFGLTGGTGVNTAGSTIKRTSADGAELIYTYDSTAGSPTLGKYVNKDGAGSYDTLTYNSGTDKWTWVDGDTRTTETFELQVAGTYRIKTLADTDGNALTYSYNNATDSLITQVLSVNGERTDLIYNATKQLTQINVVNSSSVTTTRVRYTYESALATARLISVSTDLTPADGVIADGKTYTTTYAYDGVSKRIASITNSDGTKTTFTYETTGLFRVLTFKDGLNNTTTFTYPSGSTATVTDAKGQITTLTYSILTDSSQKLLTRIQGPAGSGQDINYIYDANGNVSQMTDSRGATGGNIVKYSYDANGNQTRQEDALGNTITRTFSATNQLLSETVYATPDSVPGDATYNAALPQTTRYVYDIEEHLRFMVSPEGRVTEYVYNANGTRASAIQYAGLTNIATNLYTTAGTPTEAQLTTWVGATDKTKSQRTDYSYDVRGQLSTSKLYASVDAAGAGVTGTQAITQYTYDQAGNLVQSINARNFITGYSYDGLNRISTQTDALSNVTNTVYNDTTANITAVATGTATIFANSVAVKLANGLVSINSYDLAGRLTSSTTTSTANALLGTTNYVYDTTGNLRRTTDVTGQNTYYLYDSLNRRVGVIDPNKNLTEYVYNNNNQVVRIIQYTAAVTAALNTTTEVTNVLATAGIVVSTPATDRVYRNLYDKAGRLAKQVDALNFVTEYQYDGASRLVKTIQYTNAGVIAAATGLNGELLPANVTVTADGLNDRISRQLYSDDGLLLGKLDAEGYFTQYGYDAAGRNISIARYKNAAQVFGAATIDSGLPSVVSTAPTAGNVLYVLSDAANDQTSYNLYNARGQLEGTVDALGYLTEFQYDLTGNRTLTIRYNTSISYSVGANVAASRPTASVEDQSMTATYDANNRISSNTSNPDGLVTNYTYDVVGNLTQQVRTFTGALSTENRSQFKQYDLLGRVTRELSGEGVLALQALVSPTQPQIDSIWDSYGTRYSYDLAGRVIVAIAPNGTNAAGNKTLYYYDTEGKLRYQVNTVGEVTEFIYSQFDQRTTTRQYKTLVASLATPTSGLIDDASNSASKTALTALNTGATSYVETLTAYDNAGRAVTLTDALLNVNSRSYNAFGELFTATNKIDASNNMISSYAYDKRGMVKTTTEDAAGINRITQAVYDAFGRITQTTDGRGGIVKRSYDRLGREVSVLDANSNAAALAVNNSFTTYDAFSRVMTRRDGRGVAGNYNTVSYSYNSAARSMTMTTGEGVAVTTTRNRFGETVQVTDGRLNNTTYTYNADGQLRTTTTATGTALTPTTSITTINYDAAGKVLNSVDAKLTQTSFTYDAVNRVLSRTVDPTGLNLKTEYRYDALGRQIWMRDAKSSWTRTDYNNKGQVTSIVVDPSQIPAVADANGIFTGTIANPAGALSLNITTNFTYDARSKRLTVVEGAGSAQPKTTNYVYDKLGRLTQTAIDPAGLNLRTNYTYDKNDNVVLKADANTNKTVYTYDANNRLIYTVDALGNTTKNDYDIDGNVLTSTAYITPMAAGTLTTLQSTVLTSAQTNTVVTITPTTNAADRIASNVYDKDNRRTFSIDALKYVTKYEYDANRNVTKTTKYAAALTSLPAAGVAPTVTANAAADQVMQMTYDAANRVNQSTDALGVISKYSYDENGNQLSITEAFGLATQRTTTQEFDKANRKTAAIDALNNRTETSYDALGNIVTVKDAKGAIGYFYYDAASRMTLQVNPEGAVTETLYNALGNQTDVIRYSNKVIGTLSASSKPVIGGTTGTYVTLNANADQRQVVTYDATGRKLNIKTAFANIGGQTLDTSATATQNAYIESFTYDSFGNVLTSVARNGATTTYSYDVLNRKATETLPITSRNASNVAIAVQNSFAYDALGNLTTKTEAVGLPEQRITTYTYTLNNQQASESINVYLNGTTTSTPSTKTKTYDARGNVTSETDANNKTTYHYYDLQNRKTTTIDATGVVTTMVYDAVGNKSSQTSYANKVTGQSVSNKPTSTLDAANDRTTSYTYDAVGRETSSTIQNMVVGTVNTASNTYNALTTANLTKQMEYDANGNVIRSMDANGNVMRAYYNLAGEKLAEVDAAGYLTTWTRDAYGNVSTETKYAKRLSEATVPLIVTNTTTLAQITATAATIGTTPNATVTGDRITNYSYDRLNRKLTESRANVAQGSLTALNTVVSTTVTLNNGTLTKTAATNAWTDADAYSSNALTGGAYVSATVGQITLNGMFALNADPATDKNYTSLDYAWHPTPGGVLYIYESGVSAGTFGTYTTTDVLAIEYKGTTINYLKNGTVMRTVATTAGRTFYFDSSLYNTGFVLNNIQFSTPPTTSYVYDGLNNITQKTDAANATTDWVYDNIGRQTRQSDPVFTDNTGNTAARKRMDKEYDGLNNLKRSMNRGVTDTVDAGTLSGQIETDDQISVYTYSTGGRLISETDATGAVIQYAYDNVGNISTRTLKNRRTADQILANMSTGVDDIATYTYDNVNRQLSSNSKSTAETTYTFNQVQYNSFGEVINKRTYTNTTGTLSASATWDEFAEYDQAGRVFKTNSEDGVVKVMLYDKNGNVTLKVTSSDAANTISTTQNTQVGLTALLATANTLRSMSVYDARNQLLTTIQAAMDINRQVGAITTSTGTNNLANSVNPITTNVDPAQTVNPINAGDVSLSVANGIVTYQNSYARSGTINYTNNVLVTIPAGYNLTSNSIKVDIYMTTTGSNGTVNAVSTGYIAAGASTVSIPVAMANGSTSTVQNTTTTTNQYGQPVVTVNLYGGSTTYYNEPSATSFRMVLSDSGNGLKYVDQSWAPVPASDSTSPSRLLKLKGQPTGTSRVLLSYRPAGSNGRATTVAMSPVLNTLGQPVDGFFSFDYSSLLLGAYEFSYVALDASGNILNQQSGNFNTALAGSPATVTLNAPKAITLNPTNTVSFDGINLTKVGGANAVWDAGVFSKNSFTGNAYVSAKAGQISKGGMIALNSDPMTDKSYASLDYAWYPYSDGKLYIYENSVNVLAGGYGTYTPSDVLAIEYTGTSVKYLKNGVVMRTVATTAGRTFSMDSSFYDVGFTFNDVKFGATAATATDLIINTDNSLVKTLASNAWGDADAVSKNGLTGSAYVSARAGQANLYGMFGLNSDPLTDKNYTSLDYAWYPYANGQLYAQENGASIGPLGAYTASDVLAIEYTGTTVNYLKNGVVMRTVATTAGRTFYMDTSFYNVGFTLNDVKFGTTAATATDVVLNDDNSLTNTGGTNGYWNSDTYSLNSFTGGAYVTARADQTNLYGMFGLNSDPLTNKSYETLDYAWYNYANGQLYVYESGVIVGPVGTYTPTDVLAIEYTGTAVNYLKNGAVIRTVATTVGRTFFMDSSFYSTGFTLNDVKFGATAATATAVNASTVTVTATPIAAQAGLALGGLGRAFISDATSTGLSTNGLQLVNQGSTADNVTLKYRVKGSNSAWSTIAPASFVKSAANAGYGLGHFSLATANMSVFANSTIYEVELEVRDVSNNLLRITSTEISRDAAGVLNASLVLSLKKLRLGGQPTTATYVDVAYRAVGSTGAYSTPVRVYPTAAGSGLFDWDITGIPAGNQDISIKSYDTSNVLLNNYQSLISFGPNSAVVNAISSLNNPRYISIVPPGANNVDYVVAGYRLKNTTVAFTPLPLSTTFMNGANKEFRIAIPILNGGDYEYTYTAYGIDTANYVDPASITITPPTGTQAPVAPSAPVYSENFNGTAPDFNMWGTANGNLFVSGGGTASGKLILNNGPAATEFWPGFRSNTSFTYTAGQMFSAEVTLGALSAGRSIAIGIEGSDASGGRQHFVNFNNTGVSSSTYSVANSWGGNGSSLVTQANTTYVVEIETTATGTTLYVYQKGLTRAQGWTDTNLTGAWTSFEIKGSTYEAVGQAVANNSIDNITIGAISNTPLTSGSIQAKYALKVSVPANPAEGYVPPAPSWINVTTTAVTSVNGETQYKLNLPANLAEDEYIFEYQTYTLVTDTSSPNYNTYQWSAPVQGTFSSTILTKALESNIGEFTVTANSTGISNTQSQWTWTSPTNTLATIARQQSYNAFGEVASETDGRGNVSQYTYSTLGKLTRKQDPSASITLDNGFKQNVTPVTTYTYDAIGRMLATTDANGNVNRQTWLAGGSGEQTTSEWHADGGIKTRQYDIFGNKVIEIDEVGRITNYTFDKDNQLTQITRPSGAIDKYSYDEAGQRVAHTNALNDVEKSYYDSLGRITQTKTNMGFTTSYTYTYTTSVIGLGGATVSGWINTTTDAVGRTMTDTTDMFKRTFKHIDLGNHIFSYNYNRAGWLTSQTGTTGQNIVYAHYNNGYIKSIHDKAVGMYTFYEYDADGNKAFEGYVSLKDPNNIAAGYQDYFQQATISYDALNRMVSVVDPRAAITYEYDAVGNRRMVRSEYKDGINGALKVQEYWYKYDSMNRFLITLGQLPQVSGVTQRGTSATDITKQITQGSAGSDGVSISYDAAGQRVQAVNAKNGNNNETYAYNQDGYLTAVTINGVLRSYRSNDVLGRVTQLTEYNSNGAVSYWQVNTYDKDNRTLTQQDNSGSKTWFDYFTNNADNAYAASGAGGLAHTFSDSDGDGNRRSGTIVDTTYDYEYWDDAKMSAITADPYNRAIKKSNRKWANGYSDISYDVNGHIAAAVDYKGNRNIRYISDAQGLILLRDEITGTIARPNYRYYASTYNAGTVANKVERFYYVDGKAVGGVGNDGPSRVDYVQSMANRSSQRGNYAGWKPVASADFDQNYEPISPTNPGPVASSYTVRNGDTLQSIARTVWGDASMWYLIADANGLASGQTLSANMVLIIPNKVTNIHNNAGTFRPYNPGEAIGDLNPTIPAMPKPPKKKKCGGLGAILAAIVTIAVTIATGGNAVLGNLAGQLVGIATGAQKGFNFSSFAMSVVGQFGGLPQVDLGNKIASAAANAAVSNVASQGLGIITGQQKGFSWASVAASAVGGAVGNYVGGKLDAKLPSSVNGTANLANNVIKGVASGIAGNVASQLTQIAIDGKGRLNWTSVAVSGVYGAGSGLEANRRLEADRAAQGLVSQPLYSTAPTQKGAFTQELLNSQQVEVAEDKKYGFNGLRNTYFDNGLTSQDDLAAVQAGGLRVRTLGEVKDVPPAQGIKIKTDAADKVKNQAEELNDANNTTRPQRPIALTPKMNGVTSLKNTNPDLDSIAWGMSTDASDFGDRVVGAERAAVGATKIRSLKILQKASPLQTPNLRKVGGAFDLDEAKNVFKSPDGKTIQELSKASAKYGAGLKSIAFVGNVATAVEETGYILQTPEGKRMQAVGSSVTNVVGDTGATAGGMSVGAWVGLIGGPAAPVTVPLFAAIGGYLGHKVWDDQAKPFYRELWTGIPEPKK